MFGIDDMLGSTALAMGGNLLSQAPQMLFNARQAAMNRDWQENMANTQIQRRMADAEAAGINPIFAMSGGSGAATGGGSAASVGGGPDFATSALSAASAYKTFQEGRKSKVEADLLSEGKFPQPVRDLADKVGGWISGFDLPGMIASGASSAKEVSHTVQGVLSGVQEDVSEAVRKMEDKLRGITPGGIHVNPAYSARQQSAINPGVDVTPGGAFVGNRPGMTSQLGRLRSRALERLVPGGSR